MLRLQPARSACRWSLGAQLFVSPQGMPSSPASPWQGPTLVTCPPAALWVLPGPHPQASRGRCCLVVPDRSEQTAQGQHGSTSLSQHTEARCAAEFRCPQTLKSQDSCYTELCGLDQPWAFLHRHLWTGTNRVNTQKSKKTLTDPGQVEVCHQAGYKRDSGFRALYNWGSGEELWACGLLLCI